MTTPDDLTGKWQVGDQVRFGHRSGSDAHLHSATVVGVRVHTASDGRPVERYTVEIDPADGSGRTQPDPGHLSPPE
jgi:hypothetical protein